jgi:hypothetical protein
MTRVYEANARKADDRTLLRELPGANHLDVVDASTSVVQTTVEAIRWALSASH